MKKGKVSKKLGLKKETVSNLNLKDVKGGARISFIADCYTAETVCITLKC